MAKAIVIVLVMVVTIETTNGIRDKQMTSNVTQTLDFLLARNRYDKRLRPGFGGSPITISVNFFIKSMGPVSDNDQSFGLDCYFRQHWYDLRLRYQKLPGLEEFSMSWLFLDRVWKPDTYFVNGKKSFLHRITVPNKFLRLRHDGFITYSMRLTISASCPMNLRKFPLDAQRCPLVLGSYGYTNKDLVYKWTDETPIGLQQGVEIAQFDLVNITNEDEKILIKGGLSYSTVQANFWLKRHTGYFMLQVYIPCGLIVVCSWVYVPCGLIVLSSWVSFWIDPDDVAARVALGVTTVLSLTTMGFGGRAQLPKVSYWTALDWFVIICFTSVFSVMIEYAIVNFKDKFTKDFKKLILSRKEEEEKLEEPEMHLSQLQARSYSIKAKAPRRQRSASFSFTSFKPEGDDGKFKTFETVGQLEVRPSMTRLNIAKNFPPKSPTTADASEKLQKKRWKSIPNLKTIADVKDEAPKTFRTEVEDLIDFETEVGQIEVILDVEAEEPMEWETPEEVYKERRTFENFLKVIRSPKKLWEKFRNLSGRVDISSAVESSDPANKFSKIDVQSRRSFPIAFFISLIIYLFAFSYYLTDDFPVRDPDLVFYKN